MRPLNVLENWARKHARVAVILKNKEIITGLLLGVDLNLNIVLQVERGPEWIKDFIGKEAIIRGSSIWLIARI